ncbi:hypothetical protein ACSTG0_23485, partial [Vibrio parahaemolyticus]
DKALVNSDSIFFANNKWNILVSLDFTGVAHIKESEVSAEGFIVIETKNINIKKEILKNFQQ